MAPKPELVGSVFERQSSGFVNAAPSTESRKTGFPLAEHRSKGVDRKSKSAFARNREQQPKSAAISVHIPTVQTANSRNSQAPSNILASESQRQSQSEAEMRIQISEENQRRVDAMSPEELEQERREIIERFGSGIGDLLKRAKAARERQTAGNTSGAHHS